MTVRQRHTTMPDSTKHLPDTLTIHSDTTNTDITIPHPTTDITAHQQTVWNFAMGANMATKCLIGRRKITPLQSKPGILHHYELDFTLRGIPYIEPAFGNVAVNRHACVHGVLHELTAYDFVRLMRSEAGGNATTHGYIAKDVLVNAYDGTQVHARVLQCIDGASQYVSHPEVLYPSARYMNLLITGAHEFKLDSKYIAWLQNVPTQRKHPLLYAVWICVALIHLCVLAPYFVYLAVYYTVLHDTGKIRPMFFLALIQSLWLYHKCYERFVPHTHASKPPFFVDTSAGQADIPNNQT